MLETTMIEMPNIIIWLVIAVTILTVARDIIYVYIKYLEWQSKKIKAGRDGKAD